MKLHLEQSSSLTFIETATKTLEKRNPKLDCKLEQSSELLKVWLPGLRETQNSIFEKFSSGHSTEMKIWLQE